MILQTAVQGRGLRLGCGWKVPNSSRSRMKQVEQKRKGEVQTDQMIELVEVSLNLWETESP